MWRTEMTRAEYNLLFQPPTKPPLTSDGTSQSQLALLLGNGSAAPVPKYVNTRRIASPLPRREIIRMWVCWGFVYYSEGERPRWWEKIQRPTGRIIEDRREWIIAVRFSWLVSPADGFIQKQPVFHLVNRFPHIKNERSSFLFLCVLKWKGELWPYT